MASSKFQVIEHTIPCQPIREYHRAVKPDSPALQLACYEPLWEHLLTLKTVKIKAIWIADCSHQGASGVLNQHSLGDDPNWFDHSRDLLFMVNHFRDLIKPPVMGIAHIFSCAQFVPLSMMHLRLFNSLVFVEPMIQVERPSKPGSRSPALWTSSRPDVWSSLQDAERYIRGSAFWRTWDPKAVDQYIQFGLRPVPTALYPNSSPSAITLTTTKAQEAWTYLRLNVTQDNSGGNYREHFLAADLAPIPRDGHNNNPDYMTVCPWSCIAFEYLPYMRPSVLFIFGEKSHINVPQRRAAKLERTGKGLRGNGGVAGGRVVAEILTGASHMAPLEKVHDTARVLSTWLASQIELYQTEKVFWYHKYNSQKSERNQMALSAEWIKCVRQPVDTKRTRKSRL
ncbi:hypothetical protein BDW59DRAFT_178235 [Aspergillus cavernicola]|uniref:Toxin biosynthesis protein n=1 Tax=Aspergillus cavernicola TaxID=176166 RepID=A0ABR4HDA6_9EURO